MYVLKRSDGVYWGGLHSWCKLVDAAATSDEDEALFQADNWNDWFAMKGYPYRVEVIEQQLSEWNQ